MLPDQFDPVDGAVLNLDAVSDELGRLPVVGPCSDRELFLDLPGAGWAWTGPPFPEASPAIEREFLSYDFDYRR